MNHELEKDLMRQGAVPIEPKANWRTTVDLVDRVTDYWKEHYPFTQEATIRPNAEFPDKPQLHYFDSDWHLGAIGFQGGVFQRDMELLESTPNAFLTTNGDDVDIGLFKDLAHLQAIPRYSQVLAIRDLAEELTMRNPRDRQIWLASCAGNHTFTIFEKVGMLFEGFLNSSNLVLFPGMGRLTMQVGEQEYKVVMAHRHSGRSKLNLTLASKRLMEYYWPEADIAVTGHYHERAFERFERGGKDRLALALGTRRTAEQLFELSRGYGNPSGPGVGVVLYPNEHRFKVLDGNTVPKVVEEFKKEL